MDDSPALERRLMGADPDGSHGRRLLHLGEWVTIFQESGQELVDEMGMRAAVPAALLAATRAVPISKISALWESPENSSSL